MPEGMMVIRVSQRVMIVANDGLNYELKIRKSRKSKDSDSVIHYWKAVGYYGDLKSSIVGALNKGLCRGSSAIELKDVIDRINLFEERMSQACSAMTSLKAAADLEGVFGDEGFGDIWGDDDELQG